jgi:hypothetical protein
MLTILPATIKANEAHPISSIFVNDKIKFNKLSKYLFYGNFCNIEKKKDLLSGVNKIERVDICDVNENSYYIFGGYGLNDISKEISSVYIDIAIDNNSELCFRIIKYQLISLGRNNGFIGNGMSPMIVDFVKNCNKLKYEKKDKKYFKKIGNEKVHKNYFGERITVYGESEGVVHGEGSPFAFNLYNGSNHFVCVYWHYIHKSEKVLNVLREIKNGSSKNVSCHGRVSDIIYRRSNGILQWEIETSDMDIIE